MSAATAAAYRIMLSDSEHPLALAGLDDSLGVPPHPEVGLDGAGVPERADDLAVDGGVLALRGDHRVDVGRRPADVDDEHVAAHDVGEHLDAAEHGVRRGGLDQLGEPAAAGEPLAADDVGEEGLADGGARRLGRDDPDARQHVVGRRRGAARSTPAAQRPRRRRRRCRRRRPGAASRALAMRSALCSSTSALPPSVPPTSSTRSGAAARSAATSAPVIGPHATCTTFAPADRPDPVPGLGGHLTLVADDGQPQPSPGARADAARRPARRAARVRRARRPRRP